MIADVAIAFSGVVASSVLITKRRSQKIWRLCLTTEISAKLSAEDTKMMNGDSARYF